MKYNEIQFNYGNFYTYQDSKKIYLAYLSDKNILLNYEDLLPVDFAIYNHDTGEFTDINNNLVATIDKAGYLRTKTCDKFSLFAKLTPDSFQDFTNYINKNLENERQEKAKKIEEQQELERKQKQQQQQALKLQQQQQELERKQKEQQQQALKLQQQQELERKQKEQQQQALKLQQQQELERKQKEQQQQALKIQQQQELERKQKQQQQQALKIQQQKLQKLAEETNSKSRTEEEASPISVLAVLGILILSIPFFKFTSVLFNTMSASDYSEYWWHLLLMCGSGAFMLICPKQYRFLDYLEVAFEYTIVTSILVIVFYFFQDVSIFSKIFSIIFIPILLGLSYAIPTLIGIYMNKAIKNFRY